MHLLLRSRLDGAVGIVEMALDRLSERGIADLDEDRVPAMVSNPTVVLCGDQPEPSTMLWQGGRTTSFAA